MIATDHHTTDEPSGKLSDEHKALIDRLIGQSEYNPYRRWLIGHPNDAQRLPVYQIKAASDLAVLAAPTLGILIKGSDYLETQRAFSKALLAELGKPLGTVVAVTCTAPFDHNGHTKPLPGITAHNGPDTDAHPAPEEPIVKANETPEAALPATDSGQPDDADNPLTELFGQITDEVPEGDRLDASDPEQLGLL